MRHIAGSVAIAFVMTTPLASAQSISTAPINKAKFAST
jgi:hypothetical protein